MQPYAPERMMTKEGTRVTKGGTHRLMDKIVTMTQK